MLVAPDTTAGVTHAVKLSIHKASLTSSQLGHQCHPDAMTQRPRLPDRPSNFRFVKIAMMKSSSPPSDEVARLEALYQYQVLDTAPESAFDDLTLLAAQICDVPIALVSLVDADRQWLKSSVGLEAAETSRDVSFCAHAIHQSELFVVRDAREDERFATNPLVTGEPSIRFYAGAPLLTSAGHAIGTLCAIDRVPRELSGQQQEALRALARQVMMQLELRRHTAYLVQTNEDLSKEISERRFTEQALRGSKECYQQVVDQAGDIIYKADGNGRFTLVNPTMTRILKYTAEELMRMRYLDLIHASYREPAERFYTRQFLKKIANTYFEFPVVARDGTEVWLGQNVQLITENTEGVEFQAVARDITERRAAEQALRQAHDDLELRVAKRTAELAQANAELQAESAERQVVEAALQQSERDYRGLFENAHDAIILLDPTDETVLEVNQRACEIYALARSEFIGLSLKAISQNAVRGEQQVRETLKTETNLHFETVQYREDGTEMFLEINATTIDYKDRRAILSINRDITERKRSERRLKQSEEWLSAIFEASRDGIIVEENEHIVYANKAYAHLFGYDRSEEMLGKHVSLVQEHEPDERMLGYGRKRLRGEATPSTYEFVGRRKDATTVDLEASVSTFAIDGTIYIITVARDITERRAAEAALRESEARYREIFERDLAGNYISTPDGKLLACNHAFARIIGFGSVEEALGCNLAPLYPDAKAREAFLDLVRREKKIEHHEAELHRRDKTSVHIVENAIGTFNPQGELVELQGYLFDNTAHKKLEEQLHQSQKMDAVGQLAGGVAHDFNNILTAINGYSDLILMRLAEGDALRPKVLEIKKAGERAASLTRQLLAFSRKQMLQPISLNLNTAVTEMHKMLERLIGENIDLATTSEPKLWPVKADPGQIEQVLLNLAVNARDAMPHGGRLLIETSNVELDEEYARSSAALLPGRYVLLAVSDTGCGMDHQTRARIFEPFFTTKEQGKGTGLGLSTVYGIVKQSGGHTAVYSEPGAGTTFKVYLPQAEEAAQSRVPGAPPAELLRGSETVLLVEDEEMVRVMTRESLQISGYTVLEAADGNEALRIYEQHKGQIDLTLTDVVMPQMGGRELVERLRPLCPQMRVLYMSGYTDNAIVHHGVLEAGTAFLQKPFTPVSLTRKIREVLDG